MTEPKWISIERIGSDFEEELDVSRPNGPTRHRRRGTEEWFDGPPDLTLDVFLHGDGTGRKTGLFSR